MAESPEHAPDLEYANDKKRLSLVTGDDIPNYDSLQAGQHIDALLAEDNAHDISFRTMSWQKASWLLCGDQVCLAIMAQTWSLSVLGWGELHAVLL